MHRVLSGRDRPQFVVFYQEDLTSDRDSKVNRTGISGIGSVIFPTTTDSAGRSNIELLLFFPVEPISFRDGSRFLFFLVSTACLLSRDVLERRWGGGAKLGGFFLVGFELWYSTGFWQ